jgi:hypothetical protein
MAHPAEPSAEPGRLPGQPDALANGQELDLERKASERSALLRDASTVRKVGIVFVVCVAQFLNIALLSSLCASSPGREDALAGPGRSSRAGPSLLAVISNPVTSRDIGLPPADALWVSTFLASDYATQPVVD